MNDLNRTPPRFLLLGSALFCVFLSFFGCNVDRHFIFFPTQTIERTPGTMGIDYEEVHFQTSDGVQLNGWYVETPGSLGVLLWFHGNGGNIGDRVEQIRFFRDVLPVDLFIFDYRGYGKSEGTPSEAGTYRDADAALAYLKGRFPEQRKPIVYYGQSLGSAVAVDLAVRKAPEGLILEAPFTSIRDMARIVYPYLPVELLIRTEFDSYSKISRLESPLFILHGDHDETVPLELGKKLYGRAPEPKVFFTLKGAGHNDTYLRGGSAYRREVSRFIQSVVDSP